MSELERDNPRPLELRGSLDLRIPHVESRLQDLAQQVEELKNKSGRKDFWEKIQALSLPSLFSSLLLGWLGWLFTGSVNQALEERQVELAAVKEMETLIVAMEDKKLDLATAGRTAAELASFGRYSVPAFVNLLEVGNQFNAYTAIGAEQGLRMVAAAEPGVVCAQITQVIRNRSGLYHWQTHQTALQIIGDTNCQSARDAVAQYERDCSSLQAYQGMVAGPKPEAVEYERIHTLSTRTRERLEHAPKPTGWTRLRRFFTPRFGQGED